MVLPVDASEVLSRQITLLFGLRSSLVDFATYLLFSVYAIQFSLNSTLLF